MKPLERVGLVAHVCRCAVDGMAFVWMKRETGEIMLGNKETEGWIEPPGPHPAGTLDSGLAAAPLPDGGGTEALALWRHTDPKQVVWYAVCARCWDLPDEVLHAKWLAKRASS